MVNFNFFKKSKEGNIMAINEAEKRNKKETNRRFVVYNYVKHPEFSDQITTLQIMDVFNTKDEAKVYMEKFDKSPLRPMEFQEALYR